MRVTSLRMGDDLWRLLEAEATRVGVSVSQYVREAALARACAAMGARGEDPLGLLGRLAGAAQATTTDRPSPDHDERRDRAFAHATDVRGSALVIQESALAIKAESQQARRQAQRVKGTMPPWPPDSQSPPIETSD